MTIINPFEIPIIFLRTAWMTRYQGISGGDTPVGGGAYVAEHGFGHEIFNFQSFDGNVYGYGQPPGRKDKWSEARINLLRLGATEGIDSISGALAVWVATSPTGGAFVVGWYQNATVFREWQSPPAGSDRHHEDVDFGYYVTARAEDSILLTPDERVFPVPQQEKGGFGQSNIWYADDPEQHRQFRLQLLQYIATRQLPSLSTDDSVPRQIDPLLRQRVEQVAVQATTAYFTGLGYQVDSVEKDNVGWDLNAALGKRQLKLEVKGLSGDQIIVELTPNEYAAMKDHRDAFRVCVVTSALTKPVLEVFAFSPDTGNWVSQISSDNKVMAIKEIVAARCSTL